MLAQIGDSRFAVLTLLYQKTSSARLTFTGVDFKSGPESVFLTRRTQGVDIAIEPVAGKTLERDAAVVRG